MAGRTAAASRTPPAATRTARSRAGKGWRSTARHRSGPGQAVQHLAPHGRLGRLTNPATLEPLAAGLDLRLSVVRAAAASAAGFVLDSQASEDPEIDVLVASLVHLSPADRRHVAALVRSMLARAQPAP